MNIALFDTHHTLGGAQRYLLDYARGFILHGHDVVIIAPGEGGLFAEATTQGLHVLPAPVPGSGSLSARAAGVARLAGMCRAQGVELLYANSPVAALCGGLAMRVSRGRAVWRVHSLAELEGMPRFARLWGGCLAQLHPASPAVARTLRVLLGRSSEIHIIPPGIDFAPFAARRPVARKRGERPVIGMLGRWRPSKGHEVLLHAFRQLSAGGKRAQLRLAGMADTAEEERFCALMKGAVRAAGVGDRVSIEGVIDDIGAFFAECDVLVLPAQHASCGRLALEAMAVGRPLVASCVPGLRELVSDGHTGLLVPPGQPQALADALEIVLASPALRVEMGRQARVQAETRFRLENVLEDIDRALHGRTPTCPGLVMR